MTGGGTHRTSREMGQGQKRRAEGEQHHDGLENDHLGQQCEYPPGKRHCAFPWGGQQQGDAMPMEGQVGVGGQGLVPPQVLMSLQEQGLMQQHNVIPAQGQTGREGQGFMPQAQMQLSGQYMVPGPVEDDLNPSAWRRNMNRGR
eukprot:Nk52_evm9s1400 gene=Nk52_evmTU9s1400